MGLKSGSRDAGLDDEDEPSEESADEHEADEVGAGGEQPADDERVGEPDGRTDSTDDRADSTDERADPADGPDDSTDGESAETAPTSDPGSADDDPGQAGDSAGTADRGATTTPERPSVESLPYVLRRDRVNEGRDQVPFFLREEVIDGERELRESLEAMLGEDVYKSDYREAAMVVAQERPELVAEVLRRWGYDL